MEGTKIQQREELLEACHDLRLPVAGNENLETLELYIQAAYDDFEDKAVYEDHQIDLAAEEDFDYGSIGDKSWRLKYFLNKILFFL
ncbi:MAG: hypothetical protein P8Z35_14030 [Ignavibacteriaceae bacterium]